MMVHPTQQRRTQSQTRASTRITVTTGSRTKSIQIPRWAAAASIGVFGLLVPAYVAATGYLIYRDDLLGASVARQVAIQYAYEERIAALRAEIDRVTSRHIVTTQGVEDQVDILMERQAVIDRRQQALSAVIEKARRSGVVVASTSAPLPQPKPRSTGASEGPFAYTDGQTRDVIGDKLIIRNTPPAAPAASGGEDLRPLLKQLQSSLEATQSSQSKALDAVMQASQAEAYRLAKLLQPLGLRRPEIQAAAMGGPFIPAQKVHFVEKSAMLEQILTEIAAIRRDAEALPLEAPIAAPVSSGFGNRIDPFLGSPALHAGIDFVAPDGTQARATAPGTVITAEWSGGYGNLVEIRHANGVTTRYAHLSKILVSEGDKVARNTAVGLVGSTGRSTGAHLHYETHRHGKPVDPSLFLAAGRAL